MKKFISMALALVMTLSLCTFVATPEADAFTDTDELSQYAKQAIDVVQTIDVMSGYEDDTFKPEATLTRQAAAKIICNMILGPVAAKALPTNEAPFPDVTPNTEWAGYIAYCSHEKIINGYSDNTFKPTGALTGYAFLKMLLGTLGYSVDAEGFTGSNWKVNVAKIALGIKLNKGITSDPKGENLEKGVTRGDAAIYAFNTLQGDLVEYPSQNSININGVTVSMGSGKASPQTWTTSTTSANNINSRRDTGVSGFIGGTYTGYPIVQFAERYFDKLVRQPNVWDEYTQDDFGRPCIKWFWKGVEIGTYSREPDAVFVGNPKVNAIYAALHMTEGDDSADLYINSNIPNNADLNMARANDKALDHGTNLLRYSDDDVKKGKTVAQVRNGYANSANFIGVTNGATTVTQAMVGRSIDAYGDGNHRVDRFGNGTIVECYRNEATNHVDICVISLYGGKIDAVKEATAKKDRYVTVVYADDNQAAHRPGTIANPGRNEFETEDFEEEDYVVYTYSDSAPGIKSMALMKQESGALSSRVSGENLTLDGDRYVYAKEYAFYEMTEDDLSGKSAYVVYTFRVGSLPQYEGRIVNEDDDNDYTFWIEEDEFAVDQYVLIERITIENRNGVYVSDRLNGTAPSDVQAVVRTTSGARRTYNLDDSKNYRDENNERANDVTAIARAFRAGRIVRLSSNNNGYRLHALDDKYMFSVPQFMIDGKNISSSAAGYRAYDNRYSASSDVANDGTITTPIITDSNNKVVAGGETLIVDSETHFTVQDTTNDTYKAYTGTKNVPEVKAGDSQTMAYIYHRGALAKQIFITRASDVSSASKDVTFLIAPSVSKLVRSDDGDYYDVTAIDKDVVKTLRVKAGTWFAATGSYFEPGSGIDNTDNEGNCVILNKLAYDSNDLIVEGSFVSGRVLPGRAIGIRRASDTEVRLDTNFSNSYLLDVAENVRVYYCEGGNVEQIDYEDIVNDTKDAIYFITDDSVVTYIFIVNFDDDGVPQAAANPGNGGNTPQPAATYNLDMSAATTAGYQVLTNDVTQVQAGQTFNFNVLKPDGVNSATAADTTVTLEYTSSADGNPTKSVEATENTTIWTVNIPTDIQQGSALKFVITAKAQ
ncbi:MAG: S-layer homology domain-containing protein [Oscillibacter sp.]|nr:S-layer homology domain-containing protein [Oscillibacter sp.]